MTKQTTIVVIGALRVKCLLSCFHIFTKYSGRCVGEDSIDIEETGLISVCTFSLTLSMLVKISAL